MSGLPEETELKLVLAPGEAAKLRDAAPLEGLAARRVSLNAFYFDTPARELASRGLGLRLRREGRRWKVTLKGPGEESAGLHRRPEWEFSAPGPLLDLSRLAGTPLAELRDAATLHERLAPVVATQFRRTLWLVAPQPGSRLEVALDEGRVFARGRNLPVEEIEIEVREGPVLAAFELAEALARAVAMRPEPASKLARGLALALDARPKPVYAVAASIEDAGDVAEAARRIVGACLAHAQANERGVLESGDIECVHQLRVAFRRLRSALRLFSAALPAGTEEAFAGDLRWVAAVLGRCRDWDVFVNETLPPLVAAQADARAGRALLAGARARSREARHAARQALLSPRYGLAMIRLSRWMSETAAPREGAESLKDFASGRLRKGAKRVAGPSAEFSRLDAAGRHRLRILVKRHRYAVEFLGSLFRRKAVKRHARALARAQDMLGLANDCANALAHVRDLSPPPGFLEFARGWFAAREAAGIEAATRALARVANARRFWRRKPSGSADAAAAAGSTPP